MRSDLFRLTIAKFGKAFAKKTGIQPELFERGSISRTEQAVDQALQVHILRALADVDEP